MRLCTRCGARFSGPSWTCPICRTSAPELHGFVDLCSIPPGFDPCSAVNPVVLGDIEEKHFWFSARAALIGRLIERFFPNACSLLEVGCGTGYVLGMIAQRMPTLRIVGGDLSAACLEKARRRLPHGQFYRMSAEELPFEDEFDLVCAFDVLEHVEDDQRALAGMRQAVRCGGHLVITVPQHPFLWSPHDVQSGHRRRYTRRLLCQRVSGAGWRVTYVTSFVSLLLIPMIVSRLLTKRRADDVLGAELEINGTVNAACGWFMRREVSLIESGIRFPMGGSILLVATAARR